MSARPFRSGAGTTTSWSNRPGRVRALSRLSGKLVAPITMIPSEGLKLGHQACKPMNAGKSIAHGRETRLRAYGTGCFRPPLNGWQTHPSNSASSWLRVIRMYCWSLGFLFAPTASISSMKMMHGAVFFAAASPRQSRMEETENAQQKR